jgi:PIN domain nuclease of toxin-antitoxin system
VEGKADGLAAMTQALYSADTHTLFWYEFDLPQLTAPARGAFEQAEKGQALILLNPIVLAEFYYLLRKLGRETDFLTYIGLIERNPIYRLEPISWDDLQRLPNFAEIPEMHDRLIAVQANRLGAVLVTKDPYIQASPQIRWIW